MTIAQLEAQLAQIRGLLRQNGKTDEQIDKVSIYGFLSGLSARWDPAGGFTVYANFDEATRQATQRFDALQNQYSR